MKSLLKIFAATMLILSGAACNTNGCLDNGSSLPLAGFYGSATGTSVSLSDVDIHGVGAPNDSMLLRAGTSASKVYLPMRSSQNSVSWCFHYAQDGIDDAAFNDTITFGYGSTPFFASEECGAIYQYNITQIRHTTHLIDSVVVSDSIITNVDIERIRIYFRTADSDTDSGSDETPVE